MRHEIRRRGSLRPALAFLSAVLALFVTCRKWDNPLDPVGDRPPTVPSHPSPADSGFGLDVGLVLSWQSQDPDSGDTAYFDIFFDTASPPRLVQDSWTHTTYAPTNVASATRYYWQIVAFDNHGDSAYGPLWKFQTVPALAITAPDTGAQLRMYLLDTITWTGGPTAARRSPATDPVTFKVNGGKRPLSSEMADAPVHTAALDSTVIYYSTNDGLSWIRLGQAITYGRFFWQVPAPATESARVRVCSYASTDTMTGTSGRFEIHDTLSP